MGDFLRPTRREVLKYGATAAAILSVGPLAAACSTNPSGSIKKGGTLKLGVGDGQARDTFDPARIITSMPNYAGGMLFDNLLRMDINWKLTPGLAEEFSFTSDLKTYTFKIRKGVEFHNGKTATSADVSAHFLHVLDKATGSAGRGVLSPVLDPSGISTPDPQTIVFSLKAADAFFGVKVAHYTLKIPQAGITDWINGAIGTGPFKLKSFQPGTGFQLVKNPNYWDSGKPYLDGVTCVNIPDQATKVQAVLSGDADIATDLPTASLDQISSSSTAQLLDLQSYEPFTFDVDGSIKPYSDPRVSKAMKMLIDRQKMLDIVVHGKGIVCADVLISPTDPFYPSDLKPFPYDPEQAKSLLAQAGYANGFKENIWTTKAYPLLDEGAAFGKQAWAVAKLDMTIQSTDNDTYIAAFLNKPIVMDYGLRLHPVTEMETFYYSGSGSNLSRLKDPQIDSWLAEVKATADVAKQKEIMGALMHRYNEVSAEVNPFQFSTYLAHKKRVKGLILDPMTTLQFREATLG